MGYEIKLLIGKSCLERDELEKDMTKPFDDGSGHEYKRDTNGEYIKTGRKEHWFQTMAEIDLCQLGAQGDALNRLIDETQAEAKAVAGEKVWYFYGTGDRNTEIKEDQYGVPFMPVGIRAVHGAIRLTMEKSHESRNCRRLIWAEALLRSMKEDTESLECIFFGH